MKKLKKMLPLLLPFLVIGVVVWALEATDTTHLLHKSSSSDVSTNVTGATPSTTADRSDTETQKTTKPDANSTAQNTNSSSTSDTGALKKVGVEITTYSDTGVSVNGFVSDVVEDGGTCTLTATAKSGGQILTASHPGEANATNTTCGMTTIDRSKFHSGSWSLVLSYKSTTAKGSSDPLELTL